MASGGMGRGGQSVIGTTARNLRKSLGWSQRQAAEELGVSAVHLCNIEHNRARPSQALLDRYCNLWGVDLYVLTWCESGEVQSLPSGVRRAAEKLSAAWRDQISQQVKNGVAQHDG